MNKRLTAVAISSAFLLVACGGGGGSPSASTVNTAPSSTTPVAGTTATPAPTPAVTQAPESNAQAMAAGVAVLNAARTQCGMDALITQPNLVTAANSAGNYFKLRFEENDNTYAHTQEIGKTGFTGINPWDRAAVAGYPIPAGFTSPRVGEDLSTTISPTNWVLHSKVEDAKIQTESLMNSVYHLLGLMSPAREVGASYVEAVSPFNANENGKFTAYRITFVTGTQAPTDVAAQGSNSIVTYPCQGVTAIAAFKPKLEWPNPMPDQGEAFVGTPIGVRAPTGTTMTIASYAVIDDAGVVVPSRLITADGLRIANHQAAIIPLTALAVGKTYRVMASGTFIGNGFPSTPISVNFTFTTKAAATSKLIPG